MLLQQTIEHVSIEYTCNTIVIYVGPCDLFCSFRSIFVYNACTIVTYKSILSATVHNQNVTLGK